MADGPVRAVFPIRLVVLDLDGTIIGEDFEIGERTRAAVRAAIDRGTEVAIATGRMPSSAMRFADQLGLTASSLTFTTTIATGLELHDAPLQ